MQESGEWQEKYRLLLLQAGDAAKLREQYARLESQYNALALVVNSSPEASQAAEVNTLLHVYVTCVYLCVWWSTPHLKPGCKHFVTCVYLSIWWSTPHLKPHRPLR